MILNVGGAVHQVIIQLFENYLTTFSRHRLNGRQLTSFQNLDFKSSDMQQLKVSWINKEKFFFTFWHLKRFYALSVDDKYPLYNSETIMIYLVESLFIKQFYLFIAEILALCDSYSLSSREFYFDRSPRIFENILGLYRWVKMETDHVLYFL